MLTHLICSSEFIWHMQTVHARLGTWASYLGMHYLNWSKYIKPHVILFHWRNIKLQIIKRNKTSEIYSWFEVWQHHLEIFFPKISVKSPWCLSTNMGISRNTHLHASFTIEEIGSETTPPLKCVDLSSKSVNKFEI